MPTQRSVWQRPLNVGHVWPRGFQPCAPFRRIGQYYWHGLWVHLPNLGSRLSRQERIEISSDLAFPDLPCRGPVANLSASEECQRLILPEIKPHVARFAIRSTRGFDRSGPGDQTPILRAQPSLPMSAAGLADIRDPLVIGPVTKEVSRCRHSPARLDKFLTISTVPHDRGGLARVDGRPLRQVPGAIVDTGKQSSDFVLCLFLCGRDCTFSDHTKPFQFCRIEL